MQRIHPITEESCRSHCGKPVLLYLNDGTEIQGILSRVSGGKLYLNEEGGDVSAKGRASTKKASIKSGRHGKKAGKSRKTGKIAVYTSYSRPAPGPLGISGFGSEFGPGPFFGPLLVFDLAFIAAIFVLI